MLRIVIIDDEWKGRQTLNALLTKYCTDVAIVGMADSVATGLTSLSEHQPDLVLLDIQLQDGTGFDLLNQLPSHDFQLIFTTAYNEYAIRAFKYSAIDYLLKPIDVEELEAAVERARSAPTQQTGASGTWRIRNLLNFDSTDPRITISTEQTIEILPVADILRIESNGAYSIFMMHNGDRIVSSKNLKYYEFLTAEHAFLRVHNSHVVHLKYVQRYLRKDGGLIEMTNGDCIPLSRRRRDVFLSIYAHR